MLFFSIVVYVPETHLDAVKEAMFKSGAGSMGGYRRCAWQCLGEGQFEPSDEAQPWIGTANQLEKVCEYRVEMICSNESLHAVIEAMKMAHPYETAAFSVFQQHPLVMTSHE